MTLRLLLLLPSVTLFAAVACLALVPGGLAAGTVAVLAAAALGWTGLQALVHERWVLAGLRSLSSALAGADAASAPARGWHELVNGVSALQRTSTQQGRALAQVATHSRQMEEALRLCEERYATAVRGANDGLWEWDLASRRLLCSPRWKHMLGVDEGGDSLPIEQWQQRLHPDDREAALAALRAHLRGEAERYEHPHRLMHADGRYRWVLSRGTALRRANGRAYRMVGLDTDITRIKRVESIVEAIANGTAGQSGEAFFRALVQNFAHALHVDCAFITECVDRPTTEARTLAFWRAGKFDPTFEYRLAGTPCERVIQEDQVVFHTDCLGQMFPRESGFESYLGLPLHARDGGVIGHLAFVDTSPMGEDMLMDSVYRIFAARAGVEIELGRALSRLADTETPGVLAGQV
jgi:PAS domain S-box-containing protein